MKQNKLRTLYEKDMTKKILASLLSILIGLVVGSVIIAAVGFSNPELGASSVWDGIRIVFAGRRAGWPRFSNSESSITATLT